MDIIQGRPKISSQFAMLPTMIIFLGEFMLCAIFFVCRLTDSSAFLREFRQIEIISSAEIFIRSFHCKLCRLT
jgi:hypothetical protein